MNTIRIAAKALVIQEEKLLVGKFEINGNITYRLPGGGQNHNETLHEAVKRECLEELGALVEPIDVVHTAEFIRDRYNVSLLPEGFHQVDVIFRCNLTKPIDGSLVTELDEQQIGYEWLPVDELMNYTLYPMDYRKIIIDYVKTNKTNCYLGNIK